MIDDLDYFRNCMEQAEIIPYEWDGEDRNIGAFRSKEELISWYGQPPGVVNQPYRDRAFYTRELAMLSQLIRPATIVEFGTSLGIGTCLLHWLNPDARLITVDIADETFLPGDRRVPIGYLAKHQNIPCEYVQKPSFEYQIYDVDLCFIDADHTYESVLKDSERAWLNRSMARPWAIAWHDYNDRHPGVMAAVQEFCTAKNAIRHGGRLHTKSDSDTVWMDLW